MAGRALAAIFQMLAGWRCVDVVIRLQDAPGHKAIPGDACQSYATGDRVTWLNWSQHDVPDVAMGDGEVRSELWALSR